MIGGRGADVRRARHLPFRGSGLGAGMLDRIFTAIYTRIATAAGQPLTFVLALATMTAWKCFRSAAEPPRS